MTPGSLGGGGMTDYWSRGVTGLITGKVFGGNWERMVIENTTCEAATKMCFNAKLKQTDIKHHFIDF